MTKTSVSVVAIALRLSIWCASVPTKVLLVHSKMDKCTFCSGGPEANGSVAEFEKYGRNRLAEGKLPLCAEMCSTKALIGGDTK